MQDLGFVIIVSILKQLYNNNSTIKYKSFIIYVPTEILRGIIVPDLCLPAKHISSQVQRDLLIVIMHAHVVFH